MTVTVHEITCPTCNAPAVEHIEAGRDTVGEWVVDTYIECRWCNPDEFMDITDRDALDRARARNDLEGIER